MLLVKDLMSRKIIYLSPEDTVSKFISLMENRKIHQIPIVEKKRLKGIVYYKDITKKTVLDPAKTKIKTVMRFPSPIVSPNQDVSDAARLIFKTGIRALPVVEKNKVVGLISIHDIVDSISKSKIFRQTLAEAIMSVPDIILEDTDIGKARVLMREKNISRIPVVNGDQRIKGIVTTLDLLKSIRPRERMNWYSMAAEKYRIMDIPVSTVMDRKPITVERKTSLNEIAGLMRRHKKDGVIVIEDGIPVGVVTTKDLLEVYISGLKRRGVYYQIIGLTDEDDFIVDTIDRMIRDTIEKMSKIFKPHFFFLHLKRYDKNGKIKYSIRTRFNTDKGVFISKAYAWDLRDAVDEALTKLERIMKKEKITTRDKLREKLRLKKLFK